jgi:hypothetical protein
MNAYEGRGHTGLIAATPDDMRRLSSATFATLTSLEEAVGQLVYSLLGAGRPMWWDTALCDYVVLLST